MCARHSAFSPCESGGAIWQYELCMCGQCACQPESPKPGSTTAHRHSGRGAQGHKLNAMALFSGMHVRYTKRELWRAGRWAEYISLQQSQGLGLFYLTV